MVRQRRKRCRPAPPAHGREPQRDGESDGARWRCGWWRGRDSIRIPSARSEFVEASPVLPGTSPMEGAPEAAMGATENTLEVLLENTARMKGLARSLVRDPHRADDLARGAGGPPPQRRAGPTRSPGAWLRGVLGKLASRARRDDDRRRRR